MHFHRICNFIVILNKQIRGGNSIVMAEKICPICLDPFGKRKLFSTECAHTFHDTCLKKAAKKGTRECPLCRTLIPEFQTMRKKRKQEEIDPSLLLGISNAVQLEAEMVEQARLLKEAKKNKRRKNSTNYSLNPNVPPVVSFLELLW